MDRETEALTESLVKRHREKTAICRPRREAWTSSFPDSPQKEPAWEAAYVDPDGLPFMLRVANLIISGVQALGGSQAGTVENGRAQD